MTRYDRLLLVIEGHEPNSEFPPECGCGFIAGGDAGTWASHLASVIYAKWLGETDVPAAIARERSAE